MKLGPFSFDIMWTSTREAVILSIILKKNIILAVAVSFECFCNYRITGTDDAILFFMGKDKNGKFLNLVVPYLMFVAGNPFYKKP